MVEAPTLQDRLGGAGPDGKRSLRLWLRLLTCSSVIERRISTRLREDFGETLPRFDFLAALERRGAEGLSLGEVSRMLMVTNGNTTGLSTRLERDGLIERFERPGDRRSQFVRLTALGAERFAAMAAAHQAWIDEAFAGLGDGETEGLMRLLDQMKASLHATMET